MPTYVPITDPDDIATVERWTRRALILSVLTYVAGLAVWPFAPPTPAARYATAAIALVVMAAVHVIVLRPVGYKKWIRENDFRRGVRNAALPYPLSLRNALANAWVGTCMLPLLYGLLGVDFNILLALWIAAPLFTTGMVLLAAGFRFREPSEPSCPKCGYPTEGLTFPAMCSECAKPIPTSNQAVRVRHVRRPVHAWSGIALLLLTGALLFGTMVRPGALMRVLPRQANLALAPIDRASFNALDPVTLSSDERATLIDAILDARQTRESYQISTQLDWLDAQFVGGVMTPAQTDRYAREGWTLGITTHLDPMPGLSLMLSLEGEPPAHGIGNVNWTCFVASITVNGQPVLWNKTEPYNADYLDWDWSRRRQRYEQGDFPQPMVRVTAPSTGPMTVRARIIACVTPRGAPPPTITWHDDGAYTLAPPQPTVHEVTAERVYEVGS